MGKYKSLIQTWREIADDRLAENPQDAAALGLQKCANDLEKALASNAGERILGAILLGALLLVEARPQHLQERGTTTRKLAEPRENLFLPNSRPFEIPSEHTHSEQEEAPAFSVKAPIGPSGSILPPASQTYTLA